MRWPTFRNTTQDLCVYKNNRSKSERGKKRFVRKHESVYGDIWGAELLQAVQRHVMLLQLQGEERQLYQEHNPETKRNNCDERGPTRCLYCYKKALGVSGACIIEKLTTTQQIGMMKGIMKDAFGNNAGEWIRSFSHVWCSNSFWSFLHMMELHFLITLQCLGEQTLFKNCQKSYCPWILNASAFAFNLSLL